MLQTLHRHCTGTAPAMHHPCAIPAHYYPCHYPSLSDVYQDLTSVCHQTRMKISPWMDGLNSQNESVPRLLSYHQRLTLHQHSARSITLPTPSLRHALQDRTVAKMIEVDVKISITAPSLCHHCTITAPSSRRMKTLTMRK